MPMSRETYYPTVHVTRDLPQKIDESVPPEDLPEVTVKGDSVCRCPYCSNMFRVKQTGADDKGIIRDDTQHCSKCGHVWKKRSTDPKKCPKCGSYRWNVTDTVFECQKCHHRWTSSAPDGPQRCPSCRTYDWRIPPSATGPITPRNPHENTLKRWVCERYESGMGILDIAQELELPALKVSNLVKQYLDVESPRY